MGVWLGPRGNASAAYQEPVVTLLSGTQPTRYDDTPSADGKKNWELVFTAGCRIRFEKVVDKIDVFVVGGGCPGANGTYSNATSHGGAGGTGGQCVTRFGVEVHAGTEYEIVIGGSNQGSSGFGVSAVTAGGSAGGTGAYTNAGLNSGADATAATPGVLAFGGATKYNNGYLYGAGGGGGGAKNSDNYYERARSKGGASGGGDGADADDHEGNNGAANSGGGGGGGAFYGYYGSGGAGGSGIVIIRNHR